MKTRIILFLWAVYFFVTPTTEFFVFTSEEKELIYDYNVVTTVTTNFTKNYATKFYLTGKLHIQRSDNSLLLRLSSLTYKLYNGFLREGYEDIIDEIPVSNEYEDLLRIFRIDYTLNGHVSNVTTEIKENLHARNVKKSLALLLQIDLRCVSDNKTQEFLTKEFFTWENATVSYNVTKILEGLVVQKQIFEDFDPSPNHLCRVTNSHYGSITSRYFISNKCLVEKIKGSGTSIFNDYVLHFKQTLELIENDYVTERFVIYDEKTQNLTYIVDDVVSLGITKEGIVSGFETKSSEIYHNIQELILELQWNNNKRANFVERLLHLLRSFESLDKLYQRISDWSLGNKQYLVLVHQLLPYIGTRASHLLIQHLVNDNKLSEHTFISLLTQLPFYAVVTFNLDNLEYLVEIDAGTATLCFANLLAQMRTLNNSVEYSRDCFRYASYFIEKATTSTENSKKLLYLIAASNTACENAQSFLISVVRNSSFSFTMRQWAMRRLPHLIKPADAVFETFWSIFNDTNQSVNIRKTAYALIMETTPSPSHLLQIHNYIEEENNVELYEFHYSYLSTFAKSTNFCHQSIKESLSEILDLVQKRNRTEPTGYYELLLTVELTAYLTYDTNSMFLRFKSNNDQNPNSLLISVDGAQATFDSNFKNVTLLIPDLETIKIVIMVERNHLITQLRSFNASNLQELEQTIKLLLGEENGDLKYNLHFKKFSKTNFGLPFEASFSDISLYHQNWTIHKNFSNFFNAQIKGYWNSTTILQNKLKFYNPLADAWQGVKSYQSKTAELNVNVGLNVFVEKGAYKVFFSIDLKEEVKNHENDSVTAIFVNEGTYYNAVLSKCCESCQNWYLID